MKCVRCGKETNNKTSFCDECENYINNKEEKNTVGDINLGYMLVLMSVIAVSIMLAVIIYCCK